MKTFPLRLVAALTLALASFILGQFFARKQVGAPRLTIWISSVVWEGPNGFNSASVFNAAPTKRAALELLNETIQAQHPGAHVVSEITNPIPDSIIERVCASRR